MPIIINYFLHLFLASLLIIIFVILYTRATPFDEILLIRQGNHAAALSLGGALIGFSLTLASCIIHTTDYQQFLIWAAGAMIVQVLSYIATSRLLNISKEHIETGNTAYGALLGAISLSLGAINAACIA